MVVRRRFNMNNILFVRFICLSLGELIDREIRLAQRRLCSDSALD